jgi:hypothetical protein
MLRARKGFEFVEITLQIDSAYDRLVQQNRAEVEKALNRAVNLTMLDLSEKIDTRKSNRPAGTTFAP